MDIIKKGDAHYLTVSEGTSLLCISDVHWDNPHCDRKQLKKVLDKAMERDALICIFGDFFCAMQGKYDKRSNKEDIRPEHQTGNYLDSVVDTAAEWLAPYAKNIALITPGNHETAIQGRHETDLIKRLCDKLGVAKGDYMGWLVVGVTRSTGLNRYFCTVAYHHGYGGGGPVTKDVIQTARRAVYLPDANICVSGHTHDRWILEVPRLRLKKNGNQVRDCQTHLKLGCFKDEMIGNGWAVEKGMPPKADGGIFVKFYFDSTSNDKVLRWGAELA